MSNQETESTQEIVIKEYEEGIYMTEHKMSNMVMERFVVSNPSIVSILKKIKMTQEEQEEAVDMLVHRTPDWNDIEPEDQIERIKAVLTTETVLLYLQDKGYLRANLDLVELGVDQEGSVVVYAFYTGTNREKRRAMMKKYGEEGVKEIVESTNFLGGQNIVDMAKKKMERMQKAAEIKVKEPKKK